MGSSNGKSESPKNPDGSKVRKKKGHTLAETIAGLPPLRVTLTPQPHGGALREGGNLVGGPGRTSNLVRQRLGLSFNDRVPVLEEIADGEPMVRTQIALTAVLPFARCPACGIQGMTVSSKYEDVAHMITIAARTSARPGDRIKAIAELYRGSDLAAENVTADSILTHPEARRFLAAVHQALEELLAPTVLETVTGRIDQLLTPLARKAG